MFPSLAIKPALKIACSVMLFMALAVGRSATAGAVADDQFRQWSDSTGRFKVTARMIELNNGTVILESQDGKTLKIPVSRLSQADQDFLEAGENPFEMVDDGGTASGATASRPERAADSGRGGASSSGNSGDHGSANGGGWSVPKLVDFNKVEQITTLAGVEWNVPLPANNELGFEAKRTPLPKKTTFHEGMHQLVVNVNCQRAVVGYTVSFAVPKPLSRISLIDLTTGKALHSEQVEANMRPLALMDNGSTVLMVGASDERGGYEMADQLQVWRLQGKKLVRTPSWIPYPDDKEDWGKRMNAAVVAAYPIDDRLMVTLSDKGHVVAWDIIQREPQWHARLSDRNFGVDLSLDRKALAISDDKVLMVLDPKSGEILGSSAVPEPALMGWNRVAWSPSGTKLMLTSVGDLRVLNVENGEWETNFHLADAPIATNALDFPQEDYALLNNSLLVHLPTKIKVCNYQAAQSISSYGGTSFIAMQDQAGGIVVASSFPHPTAKEMLAKAKSDPSTFLIHPGVGVAIDVTGAGQYQANVRSGLEKAAVASGYKVDPASPIKLVGSVSGPKQEAVSYIGRGAYVVNAYQSSIKLVWNGKDLWQTGGSNVPGMLMTSAGETIEQALEKAGQSPNLQVFESARFPEFMQRPSENAQPGANAGALMSATFTVKGLIDSQ